MGHVAFKAIYVRIFAHTDRIHKRDFIAVSSWIGIALSLWIVAWIIASAIPVFSNLLSLMVSPIYTHCSMDIRKSETNIS